VAGLVKIVVHTPDSALKTPARLLRDMAADLRSSWHVARQLSSRNLRGLYRQSLFGYLLAFLPAVGLAAGLTLASEAKILNVAETPLPYPAYVMLSMVLWQTFVDSLTGPIQGTLKAAPLLARINFPKEAIVLTSLAESLFSFATRLLLVAAVFAWYRMPVPLTALLAPASLLVLMAFGTAISLLLAPVGILYRDVPKALPIVAGFWMFLTPVVYPVPAEGLLGSVMRLNPVTPLLVTTRELATSGSVSTPGPFLAASAATAVCLFLALIVFRLGVPLGVERISS